MQVLIYHAEMDFACLYSMRNPNLAYDCATRAWFAALNMKRPDLMWRAHELMTALA